MGNESWSPFAADGTCSTEFPLVIEPANRGAPGKFVGLALGFDIRCFGPDRDTVLVDLCKELGRLFVSKLSVGWNAFDDLLGVAGLKLVAKESIQLIAMPAKGRRVSWIKARIDPKRPSVEFSSNGMTVWRPPDEIEPAATDARSA